MGRQRFQRFASRPDRESLCANRVCRPSKREKELTAENAQLKAKLAKKDGVIAEIAAEYTQLKKELGEP